jgi:hypothetical protein
LRTEVTHAYGCPVRVCTVFPPVYELHVYCCALVGCGKTLVTYVGAPISCHTLVIRIFTLLRSTVVQHIIQASQKTGDLVAHFFYSHSNKFRLKAAHLFRSYIKQILGYLHLIGKPCPLGIISYVKRFYGPERYPPSFDEIIGEIFVPLSELLPNATYVVDGLDECELEEVRKVLKTFQKMMSQHGPRVFISGREGLDVTNAVPGSTAIRISNEDHKEDIRRFIDWRIEEKMRERQLTEKESVLQEIKSKLNERADRMLVQYL